MLPLVQCYSATIGTLLIKIHGPILRQLSFPHILFPTSTTCLSSALSSSSSSSVSTGITLFFLLLVIRIRFFPVGFGSGSHSFRKATASKLPSFTLLRYRRSLNLLLFEPFESISEVEQNAMLGPGEEEKGHAGKRKADSIAGVYSGDSGNRRSARMWDRREGARVVRSSFLLSLVLLSSSGFPLSVMVSVVFSPFPSAMACGGGRAKRMLEHSTFIPLSWLLQNQISIFKPLCSVAKS